MKTKEILYKEAISLLDLIEIAIEDEKKFSFIRKKVFDLANEILKLGDCNDK